MTNAAACLSASTMITEPQHHKLATLTKTTHADTEAGLEEDEHDWQENNKSQKRNRMSKHSQLSVPACHWEAQQEIYWLM